MDFSVTTKLENAWYIEPDLLAGEVDDLALDIGADPPRRPNETMTLADADFEEASPLATEDLAVRRYRDVSLKGALLAHESHESAPFPLVRAPRVAWLSWRLARASRRLVDVVEQIERGRISPLHVAAVAFCAGVVTTLLGVIIAL